MKLKALLLMSILLLSCSKTPQTFEGETTLKVALVKMEDNGATGLKIGCGDSIAYIDRTADGIKLENTRKVQLALTELFAYGATSPTDEYYNGLQHSKELAVYSVNESTAGKKSMIEVRLTGQLISAGTCDDPRVKEQIYSTIRANSNPDAEITVFINDENIEDYMSLK